MGRMAARRAKSKTPQIEKEIERKNQEEIKEIEEEYNGKGGFFACYLLCSRCPRHKGHTYIGFTVNPRRRIQQHNGEKSCGAWRTKRGRPWEMILCIYGFPTNVSALQFEWAWQHPIESLAVRKAASNFKSISGIANKIKLAYTMLNLPSWESLNLTVNFFSTKHMKHIGSCPRLPKHMRVNVCVMDELPCYVEGNIVDQDDYDVDDDGVNFKEEHINNEDVSLSSTSDTSADRIEGDTCPTENRTQEFHCSAGSPDINGSPLRCSLDEAAIDCSKSPSSCSAKQLRQSTSPKISSNSDAPVDCALISPEFVQKTRSFYSHDEHSVQWSGDSNLMLYPQDNVVNLDTPASCVVGKCSTRLKVYLDVVDLTDSPIIIQL